MKVVETENLLKIYHFGDVEVTALNRVNLEIAEHEFIAVWGPSGSGKSTFCNVIGLLDAPTEGDVRIRETSAAKLSDAKRSEIRNSYIGFVFQNFNLVPVLSALENVMLPLQIQGVSKKVAQEKATKLLEEVDLADRMGHRPQKLSGGQQQRVAIARALVTDPLLVIADEPTANLDTKSANLIVNLMRKINETRGAAFVFSTHDDRLLDRVDRKIHLQDGEVIEDITTKVSVPAPAVPEPEPAPVETPVVEQPPQRDATAPILAAGAIVAGAAAIGASAAAAATEEVAAEPELDQDAIATQPLNPTILPSAADPKPEAAAPVVPPLDIPEPVALPAPPEPEPVEENQQFLVENQPEIPEPEAIVEEVAATAPTPIAPGVPFPQAPKPELPPIREQAEPEISPEPAVVEEVVHAPIPAPVPLPPSPEVALPKIEAPQQGLTPDDMATKAINPDELLAELGEEAAKHFPQVQAPPAPPSPTGES